MKIYFAGAAGGGRVGPCPREKELNMIWSNRLWTYHYLLEFKKKDDLHGGWALFRQALGKFGCSDSNIVRG